MRNKSQISATRRNLKKCEFQFSIVARNCCFKATVVLGFTGIEKPMRFIRILFLVWSAFFGSISWLIGCILPIPYLKGWTLFSTEMVIKMPWHERGSWKKLFWYLNCKLVTVLFMPGFTYIYYTSILGYIFETEAKRARVEALRRKLSNQPSSCDTNPIAPWWLSWFYIYNVLYVGWDFGMNCMCMYVFPKEPLILHRRMVNIVLVYLVDLLLWTQHQVLKRWATHQLYIWKMHSHSIIPLPPHGSHLQKVRNQHLATPVAATKTTGGEKSPTYWKLLAFSIATPCEWYML